MALAHSQVTRTHLAPRSTPIRHANYVPKWSIYTPLLPYAYTSTVHPCPALANPHPHAELYRVDSFPGGAWHVEPVLQLLAGGEQARLCVSDSVPILSTMVGCQMGRDRRVHEEPAYLRLRTLSLRDPPHRSTAPTSQWSPVRWYAFGISLPSLLSVCCNAGLT